MCRVVMKMKGQPGSERGGRCAGRAGGRRDRTRCGVAGLAAGSCLATLQLSVLGLVTVGMDDTAPAECRKLGIRDISQSFYLCPYFGDYYFFSATRNKK